VPRQTVTLEEVSERLGISHKLIRRLIESNKIPATQVVPWAFWEIPIEAIGSVDVVQEVARAKRRPDGVLVDSNVLLDIARTIRTGATGQGGRSPSPLSTRH
jgi:hypothetical protein